METTKQEILFQKDLILKPQLFDADPNSPDADKRWHHWFRTFNTYLKSVNSSCLDKLETLVHFVNHSVYDYIADCIDYETAVDILKKIYIRPKSIVFARHLLTTCKQEAGEDVDQFLQRLKSLAKDCEFKSVTALEHCNESVRDALISGLQSSTIREKLLAQHDLSLEEAHKCARSLELAHKQSQLYNPTPNFSCTTSDSNSSESIRNELSAPTIQTCYFCGRTRHPRTKCPAKESICNNCGKIGHFQRVCRSKQSKQISNCTFSPLLSTTISAPSLVYLSRASALITVNKVRLHALFDTGSSSSYISQSAVKANDWIVHPDKSSVTMASTSLSCETCGFCYVDIQYNGISYNRFRISVLPGLCTDVLLGHDFLGLHDKIEISFGGTQGTLALRGVTAAQLTSSALFSNLAPDCKPIATKSRHHTPDDEVFIATKIKQSQKMASSNPSRVKKVYIGGLLDTVTKDDLMHELSKYGDVDDVWIARNPPGFAFAQYVKSTDAEKAVRALDGLNLCGSRVRVEFARMDSSGKGSNFRGSRSVARGPSRRYASPRRGGRYSPPYEGSRYPYDQGNMFYPDIANAMATGFPYGAYPPVMPFIPPEDIHGFPGSRRRSSILFT